MIIISLVKDKLSCRLSVCLYCSCVLSVILIWELENRNWLSTTCTLGPAEWLGWGGSGTGGQLSPGPYDDISMFGVLSWAWVSWASDLWLVADNVNSKRWDGVASHGSLSTCLRVTTILTLLSILRHLPARAQGAAVWSQQKVQITKYKMSLIMSEIFDETRDLHAAITASTESSNAVAREGNLSYR